MLKVLGVTLVLHRKFSTITVSIHFQRSWGPGRKWALLTPDLNFAPLSRSSSHACAQNSHWDNKNVCLGYWVCGNMSCQVAYNSPLPLYAVDWSYWETATWITKRFPVAAREQTPKCKYILSPCVPHCSLQQQMVFIPCVWQFSLWRWGVERSWLWNRARPAVLERP